MRGRGIYYLIDKLGKIDVDTEMKKCGWTFSLAFVWTITASLIMLIIWALIENFIFTPSNMLKDSTIGMFEPIVMVGLIILCIKLIYKDKVKEIFVFKKITSKQVYSALILGLALFFVLIFWDNVFGIVYIKLYLNTNSKSFPIFLLRLLIACIIPSICKELIFRSAIMHYARGKVFPIIFSAISFALMSFSVYGIVQYFIAGLVFAIVYFRTQNILMVIIAHVFYKFLMLLKIYWNIPFRKIFLGNSIFEICLFVAATTFLLFLLFSKKNDETIVKQSYEGGHFDAFNSAKLGIIGCVFFIILGIFI